MAVVNLKATQITNDDAKPRIPNVAVTDTGLLKESVATIVLTNGDSIASTYRLIRVKSSTRISQLLLYTDAITGCAADVGLYRTTQDGGAVVDVDFFATAQSLASAITAPVDIQFEAAAGVTDINNINKRIWQQLGLTSDPGVQYDIVLTLTGAAGATGDVSLKARFVD